METDAVFYEDVLFTISEEQENNVDGVDASLVEDNLLGTLI